MSEMSKSVFDIVFNSTFPGKVIVRADVPDDWFCIFAGKIKQFCRSIFSCLQVFSQVGSIRFSCDFGECDRIA